jgi:hypothetical protein
LTNLRSNKKLNDPNITRQVSQTIDARSVERKTGLLAQEYLKRQTSVATDVQNVINRGKVLKMEISKRSRQELEAEKAKLSKASGINKELMASIESEKPEDDKLADGFVRSKRNLEMRARDQMDSSVV